MCSDCCAALREFYIAINTVYGWQLMARSSGSECVVGSVNMSLYKAERFFKCRVQPPAACDAFLCVLRRPRRSIRDTWQQSYIDPVSCLLYMTYIVCCMSPLLRPDIPRFIDLLGQNFPLEVERPSVSPKSPGALETWEIAHWRKHKCRSDVFFTPENPKPSSHLLACCNSDGPSAGGQGGTYFLAVHSLLNYGPKAETSFSPDDSQEIPSPSAIIA